MLCGKIVLLGSGGDNKRGQDKRKGEGELKGTARQR